MSRPKSRMSRASKRDQSVFEAAQRVNSKFGSYVVAQSPKQANCLEWIRLIWQQNVPIVVCLSDIGGKEENCHEWFDTKPGNKRKVRNRFTIRTLAVTESCSSSHYELRIRNSIGEEGGEERPLHVITYKLWQEVSVCHSTETAHLLQRIYTMEATVSNIAESPVLIHGGNTVKHTGSFVLMCMICKQLREYGVGSLIPCINLVRKHRNGVAKDRDVFAVVLQGILHFVIEEGLTTKKQKTYEQALKIVQECSAPPRKSNGVVYL